MNTTDIILAFGVFAIIAVLAWPRKPLVSQLREAVEKSPEPEVVNAFTNRVPQRDERGRFKKAA